MKKLALFLSAIICAMALVSFTHILPDGDNDVKKQEETTSTVMSDNEETSESSASHCPCSKFTFRTDIG